MSTIVGCTVSPDAFALGQVLEGGQFTRIELDRIAVTDGALARYFWVYGTTPAAFHELLVTSDLVEQVTILDELDEVFLCRVRLHEEPTGIVELVYDHDGVFLEASGTPTRWRAQLRFHTSEAAGAFYEACQVAGAPLTITEVQELHTPDVGPILAEVSLTPAQREALLLAHERGYFALPRETALADLAAELGVSDQAVSERLRRACANLARAVAATDIDHD